MSCGCNKKEKVTSLIQLSCKEEKPKEVKVKSSNCCPDNKVTYIGRVGNKIIIMMDDCTIYETELETLDRDSLGD